MIDKKVLEIEEQYDFSKVNWQDYLTNFGYLLTGMQDYLEELNRALSDVDMQICDIMHYVELYDLPDEELLKVMDLLKSCREERRKIKDEKLKAECFQRAFGNNVNIAKAKDAVQQIEKLKTRRYTPRKLNELFENRPECTGTVKDYLRRENGQPEPAIQKGVEPMEGIRKTTIYDGMEMDWIHFASQQMDFFENAPQYLCNLKICVKELDTEIEDTLEMIENANYNVTQGYKVFKKLKDLRNERKVKVKEWECLNALMENFNAVAMASVYKSSLGKMEEIVGQQEMDSVVREISVYVG